MFRSSFFLGMANIVMAAVPFCAVVAIACAQGGLIS